MSWLSIVLMAELLTYLGIYTDCAYNRKHDKDGLRWGGRFRVEKRAACETSRGLQPLPRNSISGNSFGREIFEESRSLQLRVSNEGTLALSNHCLNCELSCGSMRRLDESKATKHQLLQTLSIQGQRLTCALFQDRLFTRRDSSMVK
jgi:hypothetical protein